AAKRLGAQAAGMRGFFVKHWFLLLLVVGVLVVWLAPEWLRWSAWVDPALSGALAILLSSWSLETQSLRRAILRPQPALWASVISYALLPGLGWLMGGWLLPEADYRIGLLLVASVPCTLASAVIWTRMAGGDEATALLVTLLTNCTGWLVTTAWL